MAADAAAWPAIVGTLSTALIALLIGVPLSLGIAVYLTQLAPPWFKQPVSTTIELLAAVPSIIYGMWGLFVFVPLFAGYVQQPVSRVVEGMPIIGTILYAASPSGLGILSAGIILAFMIIPFIASIVRDMLDQIPSEHLSYPRSEFILGWVEFFNLENALNCPRRGRNEENQSKTTTG